MSSKLTCSSWVFLALTAFTLGVAIYFNQPLLVYTAVFLVVSNIVLFVWAHGSVRYMQVKRKPPKLAVATQPMEITLELENKGPAPRFGIMGFDLHNKLTPGQDYSPVAYLMAPPGERVNASYSVVPPRRGVFRVGPFYLYGGDPFGFYKSWNKIEHYTDITVLPCPIGMRSRQPDAISDLIREELGTIPRGGNSTEFLGVRDYVPGEPIKRIHWRTSARLGRLISRQYEMNVAAAVSVLLIVDDSMTYGSAVDNPLEYSITMIASLAYATIGGHFQFHYLALLGERHEHHEGTGQAFYRELAIRLARLQGGGPVDWAAARKRIANHLPRASSLIVFTGELTAQRQEELARMAPHFRGMTVVSFDRSSFDVGKRAGPKPTLSMGRGYRVLTIGYQSDLKQALARVMLRRQGQVPAMEAVKQ